MIKSIVIIICILIFVILSLMVGRTVYIEVFIFEIVDSIEYVSLFNCVDGRVFFGGKKRFGLWVDDGDLRLGWGLEEDVL